MAGRWWRGLPRLSPLPRQAGGGAEDVLSEVAKWLRDRYPKSPEASAVAFNLCQEADRG
jgi:hypothetical protein